MVHTQRFYGVCTTVHAITSVRAVENALQLEIPVNAQLIRNIIQTALRSRTTSSTSTTCRRSTGCRCHVGAEGQPGHHRQAGRALSDWPLNGPHEMKAVQERLKTFVGSGQLGPSPAATGATRR